MRSFIRRLLIVIGVIVFCSIVVFGIVLIKVLPINAQLDKIASENSADLFTYFNAKMDNGEIGVSSASLVWLQTNAYKTKDFVVPLIYSEVLYKSAQKSKKKLTEHDYIDIMTKASIMYIFADATMTGDYIRCKDKTAQSAITAIRAERFHPIYEFLSTEADRPTREKVLKEGFALEERIASRLPNQAACAHGIGAFTGGEGGYISVDEWAALRASTIESMKKAYIEKFLPAQ